MRHNRTPTCLAAVAGLLAAGSLAGAIIRVDARPALFQVPPPGKSARLAERMDIPAGSAIAFDRRNRPFIINAVEPEHYGHIAVFENGKWEKRDFTAALRAAGIETPAPEVRQLNGRAVLSFDADDALYALVPTPRRFNRKVDANGNMALLYSTDYGKTFQAYRLDSRPYLTTLESSSGGRIPASPPVIFRGRHLKDISGEGVTYPNTGTQKLNFCSLNRLELLIPQKTADGKLRFPAPVVITERANGVTSHSGANHISGRFGNRLFVGYLETPADPLTGGNPTYVAEVDLPSGRVIRRRLVATATPNVSDCHAVPTLAVAGDGTISLLTGSHGWDPEHPGFLFLRTVRPGDITEWTAPVRHGAGETYGDLAVDADDNLHVVYRVHPQLRYCRYDAAAGRWQEPVRLAEPTNWQGTYTNFTNHLFLDRRGNLYVKFLFNDQKYDGYPLVWLFSGDGGRTWRIATNAAVEQNLL